MSSQRRSSVVRLFLACALFSAWLVLLMTGFVLGGALHLALLLALVLFPWSEGAPPGHDQPSAVSVDAAEMLGE